MIMSVDYHNQKTLLPLGTCLLAALSVFIAFTRPCIAPQVVSALVPCASLTGYIAYDSLVKQYFTSNFDLIRVWENPVKILYDLSPEVHNSNGEVIVTNLGQNEAYLRPLIEAYLLNDQNVKHFYESTLNGTNPTEKYNRIRCIVENFIAEQETYAAQKQLVLHMAQDFEKQYAYVQFTHVQSRGYAESDAIAAAIVRQFVKMLMTCDAAQFGVVDCVTSSVKFEHVYYYVDRLRIFVEVMDAQEIRNAPTAMSAADRLSRIEAITNHLELYVYWYEFVYPYDNKQSSCIDDIAMCFEAQFVSNVHAFAEGLLVRNSVAQNIFMIVRDWSVQAQGILAMVGRPPVINLSHKFEKCAHTIYTRFLQDMIQKAALAEVLTDLKSTIMEKQLLTCMQQRIHQENNHAAWYYSLQKVSHLLNPNPIKYNYANAYLFDIHWRALVSVYRNDVYLDRLPQLRSKSEECDQIQNVYSQCFEWYQGISSLVTGLELETVINHPKAFNNNYGLKLFVDWLVWMPDDGNTTNNTGGGHGNGTNCDPDSDLLWKLVLIIQTQKSDSKCEEILHHLLSDLTAETEIVYLQALMVAFHSTADTLFDNEHPYHALLVSLFTTTDCLHTAWHFGDLLYHRIISSEIDSLAKHHFSCAIVKQFTSALLLPDINANTCTDLISAQVLSGSCLCPAYVTVFEAFVDDGLYFALLQKLIQNICPTPNIADTVVIKCSLQAIVMVIVPSFAETMLHHLDDSVASFVHSNHNAGQIIHLLQHLYWMIDSMHDIPDREFHAKLILYHFVSALIMDISVIDQINDETCLRTQHSGGMDEHHHHSGGFWDTLPNMDKIHLGSDSSSDDSSSDSHSHSHSHSSSDSSSSSSSSSSSDDSKQP